MSPSLVHQILAITHPYVEYLEENITKWYILVPGILIVLNVLTTLHTKYLEYKFNAKPVTNFIQDYTFGVITPLILIYYKSQGTVMEFANNFWNFKFLIKNPDVGTGELRIFGMHLIETKDPENIKAVLATQFNDFSLGTRHGFLYSLLGDGIFTLDGAGWKHSRSMLRPQFAREQIAHVKILEPHMQVFFKHIRKNKGKTFDIQELFFRLTVDSSTEFLFGSSVESLRDETIGMSPSVKNLAGRDEFADAFNYSQTINAYRFLLQQFYWLCNGTKFRKSIAAVHKFSDFYVQKALSLSQDELDEQKGYVFLYELAKQTRDPKVLRDQLLNILVAGRDTTAGLLSFVFFELARNPEVYAKLKEEIYNKFGSGEDARIDEITFESLKQCEYLKAVINESLRLYPSVPHNFRTATRNTTLPRGGGPDGMSPIVVKKGQSVMYTVLVTHRDTKTYGADANEFRPERWFEPETRKLGWAYVPFNGGPRICLGQQFALTEASYVTVRLLQEFEHLTMDPETRYPPKLMNSLTLSLLDGANVEMY
ncbi:cytochrome P450 52A4 [Candida albicans L26]|uniref:Cytochrome P450 52A4 n=1 Tax=Candida albicans P78048 TaxID=1094989 RepID=A0AB34PPG4_CANAX|nr:cytochrome P450 52A4 [Candida albicans P78048]KGR07571.1 cytochrome P450 52A4 [Candida albicans P37037]KGU03113.1 cytochrome P450 52A4 [Candida albicans L26]KGU03382.1 cytochrome P450 52A4 [Candida albicans 19F]RLP66538.1 cytochrome P450 52A4 [Candida albicans Ca529L]